MRVSSLSTSDVWSIFANSRNRFSKSWTMSGKLRYDSRDNDNGNSQQSISPSVRVQFQSRENFFYAETGAILYTNQITGLSDMNTDIYYLYLGYRYYF